MSFMAARARPPCLARGVMPRERLDALLDLVRAHTLTLVKAPPGYGKTTVAQSWAETLAGEGARVAWLSLSAQEDEPQRFFAALEAAVRGGVPQARRHGRAGDAPNDPPDDLPEDHWHDGPAPLAAGAPAGPGGEAALAVRELSIPLRHRVAWLMDRLCADPSDFYLVLDDCHEITRPEIHQALVAQCRHAPAQMHLILLGRSEPPVGLGELRARAALLEVDAQTLCFDLAETQALLGRSHGGWQPDDAPLLHELTGGWIAALRAALLAARLHGPAAQALRRQPATLRSINALFSELLARLPAVQRSFLLRTSVAERLCAGLAQRLSGQADAQALLLALERQQLFIMPLDEQPQWFALHRLFREFLLREATDADAAQVSALQRQAAHWFAEQRQWSAAIGHALAAGDVALALGWIEQHAMQVLGAGGLLTLLGWERQLRSHLLESPLRLRLAFAWGLGLAMACDKALVLLDGVQAQLGAEAPARQAALRIECLALRAVVVSTTGDHALAQALAEQCGTAEGQAPWVVNALRNVRAASHLHSGRWDSLAVAPALLDDQAPPTGASHDVTACAWRLSIRGLAELRQGHLHEAEALLEEGLRLGERSGGPASVLAALPAPTLALLRYLQDRTAEAAQLNARHLPLNQRVAPIEGLCHAYLVAARVARLHGQPGAARRLLDEARSIAAARGWRRAEVSLLQEHARLCLLDGRPAEAGAAATQIEQLAADPTRSELDRRDFGRTAACTRAWCDLTGGAAPRASAVLQDLLAQALEDGRALDALGLAGALALAQQALGSSHAARATLAQACVDLVASGALRALLDQPAPLLPLLQALAAAPAPPVLAASLPGQALLQRLLAAGAAQPGVMATNPATPVQRLSPREQHILQLLAGGRSNKEIARGLGITPETVKTHVSKIFTKLGAHNRAQAVAMAARP